MTRTHQYIRQSDGTAELFDFVADPEDRMNLADSASSAPLRNQFEATLTRLLADSTR